MRSIVDFVKGDIRDGKFIDNILLQHYIECAVHFACLNSIGNFLHHSMNYSDVNVGGRINLIKDMRSVKYKLMALSSSVTVDRVPQYLPCDESCTINLQNLYGRTKTFVESFLAHVPTSDLGWFIVALRCFKVVRAYSSGLIDEKPIGDLNNLMLYRSMVVSGKHEQLSIYYGYYDADCGTGSRD